MISDIQILKLKKNVYIKGHVQTFFKFKYHKLKILN